MSTPNIPGPPATPGADLSTEDLVDELRRRGVGDPPKARLSPGEQVQLGQEKGYVGDDAADRAGGIEALREKHHAEVNAAGDTTGSTQPVTPPGHPQDPTVQLSTTAGDSR